jgi:hypothetical protein
MLLFELSLLIPVNVEEQKLDITMKMKFAIDMNTQILNKICSRYEGISESVLIIQNVHLPGIRGYTDYTEIRLHKIFRTPHIHNKYM